MYRVILAFRNDVKNFLSLPAGSIFLKTLVDTSYFFLCKPPKMCAYFIQLKVLLISYIFPKDFSHLNFLYFLPRPCNCLGSP